MDEAQHRAARRLLDAGACDEEVGWRTGATLLEIIGLRAALAVAFPRPRRPRPHGGGPRPVRPGLTQVLPA